MLCVFLRVFALVDCEQVSEEVERALAKLGPAKLTVRYETLLSIH